MSTPVSAAPQRLGANYWKLFSASMVTNLGDGLMFVSIVWLASSLTRDAFVISLIGFASQLPWLLCSLPAGVITDRFDRRTLVVWSDVARTVLVATFAVFLALFAPSLPTPAALASGAPPTPHSAALLTALFVMSLLLGSVEVLRDNAAQTLMPAIVHPDQLEKSNSRMWGVESVMNSFVGPPLAGVLIAWSIVFPFALHAGFLAVSAVLLLSLSGTFRPQAPADADSTTSSPPARAPWHTQLREGFVWLWRHPLLRMLALLLGLLNLISAMEMSVLVLYAQELLGLFQGWKYGALLTGMAAGAVVGSLVADRISRTLGPGPSLIVAMTGLGIGTLTPGLLTNAPVVWLAAALTGIVGMLWNVITVSLRQRIIPDHLLGRVNSVYRFFAWGMMALGPLLGGAIVRLAEPAIGREWALRSVYLVGGVVIVALMLYALPRLTTDRIRRAQETAHDASTSDAEPV